MAISCASFAGMTEVLHRDFQAFPGIIPASFI